MVTRRLHVVAANESGNQLIIPHFITSNTAIKNLIDASQGL
jgi:hypothetical protein